jgi:TusA-related sulfurtransferase
MEEINSDEILDAYGLMCPVPVHLTAKKMKELKLGQILQIIADDRDTLEDIPAWCKSSGNKLLKFEVDSGVYKFYIRKESE